ncbi:MAG: energy-coupling factor ABC transporter permease, partial [Candidatus Baldrarchaeia archaeon]
VMEERHIPLFAVLTAAVFAAQMINWPVGPGGTTAHLVGGALLAIFLGPFGGLIAMTVILVIQAFFFGDGGITALGANVWNMGVVDCFVGYYLFKIISKSLGDTPRAKTIGAFVGGWIGITLAAFFCGLQIGISTVFPYEISVSIPVMTLYHCLLGLIEGLITALVITYVLKVRPDLLELPKI